LESLPATHGRGSRSANKALTAIPNVSALNASHQLDTRNNSGAAALAAATMKHTTIATVITGETLSGCRVTIDFGIWRALGAFCLLPGGLGEGALLIDIRRIKDRCERNDCHRRLYPLWQAE
jgi:hypothetical protein